MECRNPNVRNQNNAKIQTKQSSDFGHLGCLVRSIVQFELLCIGPNKIHSVWTICLGFRHKFLSKIIRILDVVRNPSFLQLNEYQLSEIRTSLDCGIPL